MAKLTGGGIQSRQRKEVGYKGGKRTLDKVSPSGVSQIGSDAVEDKGSMVPRGKVFLIQRRIFRQPASVAGIRLRSSGPKQRSA
jgi:hypothetical protein